MIPEEYPLLSVGSKNDIDTILGERKKVIARQMDHLIVMWDKVKIHMLANEQSGQLVYSSVDSVGFIALLEVDLTFKVGKLLWKTDKDGFIEPGEHINIFFKLIRNQQDEHFLGWLADLYSQIAINALMGNNQVNARFVFEDR
jgi:hypothetical protein